MDRTETRALLPRLVERAIAIAGGEKALSQHLGVAEHALKLWADDRATMPDRVLAALIDLLLEDDLARAAQDRRRDPRPLEPDNALQ